MMNVREKRATGHPHHIPSCLEGGTGHLFFSSQELQLVLDPGILANDECG